MLGEGNSTDEPEGSIMFASVEELLSWLAAIVDEEHDLGPTKAKAVHPRKRWVHSKESWSLLRILG
jgi:hypothetical protein